MELNQRLLSDLIVYMKYARYVPELQRRELWPEIVDRYAKMMMEKFPIIEREIRENLSFIHEKKILPSMRAMQFAGPAIARNNSRIYNCAYLPVDDIRAFSETMFLLSGWHGRWLLGSISSRRKIATDSTRSKAQTLSGGR
jgi:hypothetical protein